jgi:uncharacterized membrane protein
MTRLAVLAERLRSRLWPLPALSTLVAAAVAVLVVLTDGQGLRGTGPASTGAGTGLLEVLAGSSLTVLALVFSLHVVALQLAATQYSPRLLRTYVRDLRVQAVLSVLIATFVFSMTTLLLRPESPPRASVLVAAGLGLASVAGLVAVVSHIVGSLRVESMMRDIHLDAGPVVGHAYQGDLGDLPESWGAWNCDSDGVLIVVSEEAGFVQVVDREGLQTWAGQSGVRVRLAVSPGDHLLAGDQLGCVRGEQVDEDDAQRAVQTAVVVGFERTPDADAGYGLTQLGDIALRALSPSLNDPTTACHALGHLASLLGGIAEVDIGAWRRSRSDGEVVVVEPVVRMDRLLREVVRPVARSAGDDPRVWEALVTILTHVDRRGADNATTVAVRAEARYYQTVAATAFTHPADRDAVLDLLEGALAQRGAF